MSIPQKISVLLLFIGFFSCQEIAKKTSVVEIPDGFEWQDGDIIFQNSNSSQCLAIAAATHSNQTHVGIIKLENGRVYVQEAVQPVKTSWLSSFIKRGNNHYTVKRMKLSEEQKAKINSYAVGEMGKDYDIYFNWDDNQIYCSELVWKAYKSTGIILCEQNPLRSYDLSSSIVKETMEQRYGKNLPLEEPMVAPSDLFNSELLETVLEK